MFTLCWVTVVLYFIRTLGGFRNAVLCVTFLAFFSVASQGDAYGDCLFDDDCADSFFEYCCERKAPEDNVCRSDCIGESCSFDSDCATGECCDYYDKCKEECNLFDYMPVWKRVVIIISVIVAPIAVVVVRCCFKSSAVPAGGVVVTRLATAENTLRATQNQQPRQVTTVYFRQNSQPSRKIPPPRYPVDSPPPYPNQSPPPYPAD